MDRIRFWLFPALFVGLLVALGFAGCAARADELSDLITRLEKKSAPQDKPGQIDRHDVAANDPFAPKDSKGGVNYTHRYETEYGGKYVCDCGCIETGKCVCPNCCTPAKTRRADPFAQPPPPKNVCLGCTDLSDCVCPPGTCGCLACDKHAAKACPCSPACTCGCNDGQPCRCAMANHGISANSGLLGGYSRPSAARPAFLPSGGFGTCRGGG